MHEEGSITRKARKKEKVEVLGQPAMRTLSPGKGVLNFSEAPILYSMCCFPNAKCILSTCFFFF